MLSKHGEVNRAVMSNNLTGQDRQLNQVRVYCNWRAIHPAHLWVKPRELRVECPRFFALHSCQEVQLLQVDYSTTTVPHDDEVTL
jgi:hypothetical protein